MSVCDAPEDSGLGLDFGAALHRTPADPICSSGQYHRFPRSGSTRLFALLSPILLCYAQPCHGGGGNNTLTWPPCGVRHPVGSTVFFRVTCSQACLKLKGSEIPPAPITHKLRRSSVVERVLCGNRRLIHTPQA